MVSKIHAALEDSRKRLTAVVRSPRYKSKGNSLKTRAWLQEVWDWAGGA